MSVAVTVWLPAVLSVTLKVPVPLVKVVLAGKHGLPVAAGEVDGAGVVNRVVELIQGGHGVGRGRAGRDAGGAGDQEGRDHRGRDVERCKSGR